MRDINRIIEGAREVLLSHRIDEGKYSRWLWQDESGKRELGLNPYGCADAANILYMIGDFPSEAEERMHWIKTLQSFQNPETGLFEEATHHSFHTTAHCIGALELFEAKPLHSLKAMEPYLEKNALETFLSSLRWAEDPWIASHQGAGIYAAMVLTGEADSEWEEWYFKWLSEEMDPISGFWRKGMVHPILKGDSFTGVRTTPSVFPHLAASFHYLFNHEYAHWPIPFPESMIDSCLSIYEKQEWSTLGRSITFAEIDWIYCLNRAVRQSGYRFKESRVAIYSFAESYIDYINSLDFQKHDGFNDMHTLFGCICALAELQNALPGEIHSRRPLKLVLDRRPFI